MNVVWVFELWVGVCKDCAWGWLFAVCLGVFWLKEFLVSFIFGCDVRLKLV